MKTIPVCIGFDQQQVIGSMTLDETKLPPDGDYVFALGGSASGMERGVLKHFELMTVGMLSDEKYIAYLRSEGKLPNENNLDVFEERA